MMIGLDRGHFLSPTGQCKAFDASADGYSRSEGCGMFVLKRLSDAIAENDNILGIIRGVEVNQSGLAHSITNPHAPTQMALFNRLLENADIPSTRINVVEAHGTGTQAGDPCELESIRSILAANRTVRNPLYVTSIKANIGHLEAASGAAGLAKLLLMLRYRTIPRQILLQNLNPNIAPLESDHTIISTVQGPWMPSQEGQTRVALLNNFGAAGSNAALILEEFSDVRPRTSLPTDLSFVFGLSAKTESSLGVLRSRYIAWLQRPESEGIRLCDIAYTATTRRQLYPHRIAVTAKSKQELMEKLAEASASHITEHSGKVVFVFSGQGSHYLGMGASLYQAFPIFKQILTNVTHIWSHLVSLASCR
jgi:acyl transferase domain-containing protein